MVVNKNSKKFFLISLSLEETTASGVFVSFFSLPFILSLNSKKNLSSAHPFALQLPRPGRAVARPVDQEADVPSPAGPVSRSGVLGVLPENAGGRRLDVARGKAPAGDSDDDVPRGKGAVVRPRRHRLGVLTVVDDPGPAAGPSRDRGALHQVQHRLSRGGLAAGDVVAEGGSGRDLQRVAVLEGHGVAELGDHHGGEGAEDGLEGGGADARGRRGGGHAPDCFLFRVFISSFFFFFLNRIEVVSATTQNNPLLFSFSSLSLFSSLSPSLKKKNSSPVVKPVRVVPEPLPGLLRRRRVPARLQPDEGQVVAADDAGAVARARVVAVVVGQGDGDVLGRPGAVGADVFIDLESLFFDGKGREREEKKGKNTQVSFFLFSFDLSLSLKSKKSKKKKSLLT